MKSKKYFQVGVLGLVAIFAVVSANWGMRAWKRMMGKAAIKETAGHPNTISAGLYGVSPEEASTMKAAAASGGGYGENTEVQDIQPPSISGFSTDLFTGNSTVNYSLDLSPGRGGLTPSVSLVYSSASVYDQVIGADFVGPDYDTPDGSHNENDVNAWKENLYVQSSQVGLGWNIGGLGQVFRDARGRYTLVLNGQSYRLFKSPTNEDWDGETWHTEPESFLKIRHQVIANEEPGGEGSPADKFIIYDTNGTYYEFTPRGFFWKRCDYRGGKNECKQATAEWCQENYTGDWAKQCEKWASSWNRWVLNKVKDVHGNEIDIPYVEERRVVDCSGLRASEGYTYPRALYPYEINYSGVYDSAGIDAGFKAKVEFVFADREDDENMRRTENACLALYYSEKRIAKINIKVRQSDGSWKIVRQYDLDNDQYFTGKDSKALHPQLLGITARGRDDNGDGIGDQILPAYSFSYYNDSNDLHIFRLLSTADNGYGGKVQYTYQQYWTPDYDPTIGQMIGNGGGVSETHRVTEKTAFDGRGNSFETTYGYEGPRGISDDRQHSGFESLGHSQVTETVFAKNDGSKIRETKYYFIQGKEGEGQYQGRFYVWPERGRLKKTEVYDGSGTLLSSSESDYSRDPEDYGEAQSKIWDTAHFITPKETRSCQDVNTEWPVGSMATYHYRPEDQGGQQWGNLTQQTEYKVTDCVFDENSPNRPTAYRMTHNTYFPNETNHITNRVGGTQALVCNTGLAGTVADFVDCPTPKRISLAWNFYDNIERPWHSPGSKGELTSSRIWYEFPEVVGVDEFNNGQWRVVDVKSEYNQFGNVTEGVSFTNYGQISTNDGQWTLSELGNGSHPRRSTIAYETNYNSFPVLTTNPLGHQARTEYWHNETNVGHPYLANKVFTWDSNSQQSTSVLDNLGRVVSSFLPGDGIASVKIDYRDENPFIVHTQTRDDKDDGSGAAYYNSWQIYNGLGQLIESQSEVEGDGSKIALTASSYNALGQAEKTLLPYESASGGNYINPDWNQLYNEVFYDSLGRAKKSISPGNRVVQTDYHGRKTAVLDPNNHLKVSEIDSLGRLIEVQEFKNERSLGIPTDYYTKTQFDYDYFDRLLTTTDSLGKTSTVSYNQFGQKVTSDDPDLGVWHYTYYPTGALATTVDAKGQVKSFVYDDLDRMTNRYYGDIGSGSAAAVAWIDYDSSCSNGVGRLCFRKTYPNGPNGLLENLISYVYDVKGRLHSETRKIDIDGDGIYEDADETFLTSFAYDAASRQREISYPDGEKVIYAYNDAGQLINVSSDDQTYLASADYNILGLPKEEVLGNQTKNIYTYEPETYRLATKTVKGRDGADLWKQELRYDPVGNINPIIYPLKNLTINYDYDDLNRLTGMTSNEEGFYADYKYDVLGRMTLKTEEAGEPGPTTTPIPTPTPTGGPGECYEHIIQDIDKDKMLLANNLSDEDFAWITFDFYNNSGKELFWLGDYAQPKNDSIEIGERSQVPILTNILNDLPAGYQGYVVVQSHQSIDYPNYPGFIPDDPGPCIEVISGPAKDLCELYPESFLPGDLDCDLKSNMFDIMKVVVVWGLEEGDDGYKRQYDFNGNDEIDVGDIMHISTRWGEEL